jgi:hypothetical protein
VKEWFAHIDDRREDIMMSSLRLSTSYITQHAAKVNDIAFRSTSSN